ncbi:MAG: hypothetical protein WCK98_07250 [bacterium]
MHQNKYKHKIYFYQESKMGSGSRTHEEALARLEELKNSVLSPEATEKLFPANKFEMLLNRIASLNEQDSDWKAVADKVLTLVAQHDGNLATHSFADFKVSSKAEILKLLQELKAKIYFLDKVHQVKSFFRMDSEPKEKMAHAGVELVEGAVELGQALGQTKLFKGLRNSARMSATNPDNSQNTRENFQNNVQPFNRKPEASKEFASSPKEKGYNSADKVLKTYEEKMDYIQSLGQSPDDDLNAKTRGPRTIQELRRGDNDLRRMSTQDVLSTALELDKKFGIAGITVDLHSETRSVNVSFVVVLNNGQKVVLNMGPTPEGVAAGLGNPKIGTARVLENHFRKLGINFNNPARRSENGNFSPPAGSDQIPRSPQASPGNKPQSVDGVQDLPSNIRRQ